MKKTIAKVGNPDLSTRSDCFIELELTQSGGINLDVKSNADTAYEPSIIELVNDIFAFFELEHVNLKLVDGGAMEWVISARLEAAIKLVKPSTKEYLPGFISQNNYYSSRDAVRLTRLYLPGNDPESFLNAGLNKPNAIILDLEDKVQLSEKHEARLLIRNALRACNFYGAERMVRINQGKQGLTDLEYIIPHNTHVVLIPRAETVVEVQRVEERIAEIRRRNKIERRVFLLPIIESALGVERAYDIATSSDQIVALAIGLDDYTLDIGAKRTNEGLESLYARSRVINAAHAAKVQPVDSYFGEVDDDEGLLKTVMESKARGFVGMGCVNPIQVPIINKGFAPNKSELEQAKQIVYAANQASQLGVKQVAIGTKLIDPIVVKRQKTKINMALNMGMLDEGWENTM